MASAQAEEEEAAVEAALAAGDLDVCTGRRLQRSATHPAAEAAAEAAQGLPRQVAEAGARVLV